MTSKRMRRTRNRLPDVPAWAQDLLDGREPEGGVAEHDYIAWRFFDDPVPGLPDSDTSEGKALIEKLKEMHT